MVELAARQLHYQFMRVFVFLISAGLFGVLVLWWLPQNKPVLPDREYQPLPSEKVISDIRDVTPQDALPGPRLTQPDISRLPAVIPPPLPKKPPKPIALSNVIIPAAGVILKDDIRIELSGIKTTDTNKTCNSTAGTNWPCGRFARTAMRRFVRTRKINCDNFSEQVNPVRIDCQITGINIASWLVKQGWAVPEVNRFNEELKHAKELKKGMWRTDRP